MPRRPAEPWPRARTHLRRNDVVLRSIIDRVGACTLRPTENLFALLVRSIVAQQISGKAAATISARLLGACKGMLSPKAILACTDEELRAAGPPTPKRRSLR